MNANETTDITKREDVKPVFLRKVTAKEEVSFIDPSKDPQRRKEYNEADKMLSRSRIPMDAAEFNALKSGKDISWFETFRIHTFTINGKYHDTPEKDFEQAEAFVFHYDAKEPGKIHRLLFLHYDGWLFKPHDIDHLNKIIAAAKIKWLYRYQQKLIWRTEAKKREAEEKLKAEAKAKQKEEAAKKKTPRKTKSKNTKKAAL